jgi:hypothetical protein
MEESCRTFPSVTPVSITPQLPPTLDDEVTEYNYYMLMFMVLSTSDMCFVSVGADYEHLQNLNYHHQMEMLKLDCET